MLQSLCLDAASNLFQRSQRIPVSLASAQKSKVSGVDVTHLHKELPLNLYCRSVAHHRINEGDTAEVKVLRFLGRTHLVCDLSLDREVPRHEIKLIRNLCVRRDG